MSQKTETRGRGLDVVVGGQFGSEAKGHVAHRLIRKHASNGLTISNIRVAGPNAGHTVITDTHKALPLRTIPVGVATPGVDLYIGPGSEVNLDVLYDEAEMCAAAGVPIDGRLFVHPEATLLTDEHIKTETELAMHARIGSTGKGIGAARADRIMRKALRMADLDQPEKDRLKAIGVTLLDHPGVYNRLIRGYDWSVIEGTQGYGLGLHAGFYPQCTSSNCRAVDFIAMAGLTPWDFDGLGVWVTLRPYPIRVAGNSGPLRGETSWKQLNLPEEKTTVTKKTRRVGAWDGQLAKAAVDANGPRAVRLALTMADQLDPTIEGCTEITELARSQIVLDWVNRAQADTQAAVGLITTGANTGVFL